jgi:hypothetical protein
MNYRQLGGLYKSTDSGMTYVPVSGMDAGPRPISSNPAIQSVRTFGFGKGLPGRAYPALYMDGVVKLPASGDTLGIFRSDDGGTSWVRINSDSHLFSAGAIVGDSRVPGRVYLGTHGRGIVFGDP